MGWGHGGAAPCVPIALFPLPPPSPGFYGTMWGAPGAAERSIRPYRSSQQYLCAMKEDLAEWLKELYDLDIEAGTFLEVLETGAVLCSHANHVAQAAGEFARACPAAARRLRLPAAGVACNLAAQPGTFQARDNVSNFIQWCRKEMGIKGKASGSSSPGMWCAVPLQLLLASPSVFSRVCPRPVPPQCPSWDFCTKLGSHKLLLAWRWLCGVLARGGCVCSGGKMGMGMGRAQGRTALPRTAPSRP